MSYLNRKVFAGLIFANEQCILSGFHSWNNKKILFSRQKSIFACRNIWESPFVGPFALFCECIKVSVFFKVERWKSTSHVTLNRGSSCLLVFFRWAVSKIFRKFYGTHVTESYFRKNSAIPFSCDLSWNSILVKTGLYEGYFSITFQKISLNFLEQLFHDCFYTFQQ